MNQLIKQIMPFILLGMALVAFAFGIFILAYLFLMGTLIGLGLFALNWVKNRFFPNKSVVSVEKSKKGRIISSDDWRKL